MQSPRIWQATQLSQPLAHLWRAVNSLDQQYSRKKTRSLNLWTLSQSIWFQKNIKTITTDKVKPKACTSKSPKKVDVSDAQIVSLISVKKISKTRRSSTLHWFSRDLQHWEIKLSAVAQDAWQVRQRMNLGTIPKERLVAQQLLTRLRSLQESALRQSWVNVSKSDCSSVCWSSQDQPNWW